MTLASLVVEQNVGTALDVADRVYVLRNGSIAHTGPAAALRDDPPLRTALLGN